jgi:hypothetical protein
MAHREYQGPDGRKWVVWSVLPEYAERRGLTPSSAQPAVEPVAERRVRDEFRVTLAGKFSQGWLAFETEGEKWRLSPFPKHWLNMSDPELDELRATATKVEHHGRRTAE